MRYFTIVILALLSTTYIATAAGEDDGRVQEKRGAAVGYTAPTSRPAYATAAPSPAALTYSKVSQPVAAPKAVAYAAPQVQYLTHTVPVKYAPVPQQQQYEYEHQAVAYQQQPALARIPVTSGLAKISYASQTPAAAAPAPIQYSPASQVSSFSYSSPHVSYNNLGFLTQYSGKVATASAPSQSTHAAPAQQQVVYTAAAQPQQVSYSSPVKISYASAPSPVTYTAQVPRIAYTAAAPANVPYSTLSQTAKVAYANAPQQFTYQPSYSAAAAAPQQIYSAAAPQASHTIPQAVYTAAPPQYIYSAPVGKYPIPSVTYAH